MLRDLRLYAILLGLCLVLVSTAAYAAPEDAIADAVANSGVFPIGTSIISLTCDGANINLDLSMEAVPFGFSDTQSDAYSDVLFAAVVDYPEIESIYVTAGGFPISQYLPANTCPNFGPNGGPSILSAQSGTGKPDVPSLTSELAGKLVVLGPSHGAYANTSNWTRAQRTYCGPGPKTAPYPPNTSRYQPSDYYYWTKGFQWPAYYEDDMSPEIIRFLYAYCASAGADTYVNRNLDKNAGLFPWAEYGYANPGFTLPKWMTAAKYYLEDLGGIPETVWNTNDVSAQSDKDLRARAYYVNWLMETKGYTKDNTVYLALHSNAANVGSNPPAATARGTETLQSYSYTTWKTEQARSSAFATTINNAVIASIRNEYDGFWANDIYNATLNPVPVEWNSSYGTYRGYNHAGASTGTGSNGWQNRGMKSGNYGEIRECKCPAALQELVFHDDWKFYPDEAFHQDQIFRATVAWGQYEGICQFFGVTPKARLNASVENVSFPTLVGPNAAINGTIEMKNLGQAWCWGDKMIGTVYSPYTVWFLKAAADDEFGAAGTEIPIADDGVYYPGDTALFNVSLTSPGATGLYTTKWQMLKDDARGGSFGPTVTAQIQVDADAPVITITKPTEGQLLGPDVAVEFSAADALSEVAICTGEIDGTEIASGASVKLGSGSHTLTVTAVDTFGNSAAKSVTFTVDADAPVITIASPAAAAYQHFGTVAASFSAADSPAGVASVTATLDGTAIADGATIGLLATALGQHTLTVTATDNVGNTGTSSVTFTVVATIESLIGSVNELYAAGQIDNEGIQNSLLVKLAKYQKDNGDIVDAKNYLNNFINEVSAQSGKHLTVSAASTLLTDADYVIAHLPAQ